MATTETSATDSNIIIKDTTEQNTTDSRDEHMKSQVLLCSVLPFIIIAAVSVVAITGSTDKISNHSKKYPQYHESPLIINNKTVRRRAQTGGRAQTVTPEKTP